MTIEAIAAVAGTVIAAGTAAVGYVSLLTKAQLGTILVKIEALDGALRERRKGEQVLRDKVQALAIDVTRIKARMDVCPACRTAGQPENGP